METFWMDRKDARGGQYLDMKSPRAGSGALGRWLHGNISAGVIQHESRTHMSSDLARYFFLSLYASKFGHTPTLKDDKEFPKALWPDHQSVGKAFHDRFRVQLADKPATTITSHISKDGHYFIHPNPLQCRALTVREAARIQTFPDDYIFEGNRTQQYHQVGNAVPPYLAKQVAERVAEALGLES
jgi:DNA (cytosine-5)-methyltransferase 1